MIEDGDRAVEPLVDLDPGLRVAPTLGARQKLHPVRSEGDGVVVGDHPSVLEAEDGVELAVGGPGPEGRCRLSGGLSKPHVIAGEEARQRSIRALPVGDAGEAQFGDQAVLEGAEEAFDAPLGLRGGGGDPLDGGLLERAADLGGVGSTAQLLLDREGLLGGTRKDPVPVRVDRYREPGRGGEVPQEPEVALGVFLLAEAGAQDGARGVIPGSQEDEVGPRPSSQAWWLPSSCTSMPAWGRRSRCRR